MLLCNKQKKESFPTTSSSTIVVADAQGLNLLRTAMSKLNLSARAYDRILKVSRTIADLEGCANIQPQHLAEAISYRNLDREDWAG